MEAEAFGTDVGAVDREKVLGERMRRVGGMEDLRGTFDASILPHGRLFTRQIARSGGQNTSKNGML